MKRKPRYHRIDGWRGYTIPGNAIVGSSDTGEAEDSPAPSHKVAEEFRRFRREVLTPAGIKARLRTTQSSNVFMIKRWLTVDPLNFDRAARLAVTWLEQHQYDTQYIHSADLKELGYLPEREYA